MALSCGLDIADRVDGSVGWPLPSVEVRLVDADTNRTIPEGEELGPDGREREGEIQLRGPTIFSEYWKNPQATAAEFVDGSDNRGKWFKTGDIALRRTVHGAGNSQQTWAKGPMYFIQGRKSVDIIKSGGEKISALEIERELLSLPQVSEAAVVGIPSEQWGQKVAAVIVIDPRYCHSGKQGKRWGAMDMRRALRDRLAGYKIPQELRIVERMPRNAMGKSKCHLSLLEHPLLSNSQQEEPYTRSFRRITIKLKKRARYLCLQNLSMIIACSLSNVPQRSLRESPTGRIESGICAAPHDPQLAFRC